MKTLEQIAAMIATTFNTTFDKVSNVAIDDEFGNVTATINGNAFIDCGFIEDYK